MKIPNLPAHSAAVMAAALGYFVDLYDIVIFGVVRVASLTDLGLTGADNTRWGLYLLNLQMTGLLVGGFFWGWVGDRYGRRTALLATIAVYSLANLANAFVVNVEQYAVLRFLAGVGLAGELGAGITLIAELLPRRHRGFGTTLIAFMGLLGALCASFADHLSWRWAFALGGIMGLLVLALRAVVLEESSLFLEQGTARTPWRAFFRPMVLRRFAVVAAVGIPVWFCSALFVNLAPEWGVVLGFESPLRVGTVLTWQATGLALGSLLCGLASERLQSRRRIIGIALVALMLLTLAITQVSTPRTYCLLLLLIGTAIGYWSVFVTMSAEQFGTEVRALAATALPNVVRASTVPVTLVLQALWPLMGLRPATLLIAGVVFSLALLSLRILPETWGRDLGDRRTD